jgi:hypothetical protein
LDIGSNEDVFFGYNLAVSVKRLLQKCVTGSEEIEELFGFVFATVWPESASDAARHNDAIVIVVCHHKISIKVSAKLRFIFVIPSLFMINDVTNTFFEEKTRKSLEVKKKVVPLHPQSRNKPRNFEMPRWRNR